MMEIVISGNAESRKEKEGLTYTSSYVYMIVVVYHFGGFRC
jgi:hypothetical protein